MNEIMTKTYELIDALDSSDLILNLEKSKTKIKNNQEITKLLQKGKQTTDDYLRQEIKKELYKYQEYQEYMHFYNLLMYIVMDINSRYHKLTNVKGCRL